MPNADSLFLGGYRILSKVASGTFGRVYRVHDPESGRIRALKILRQRWTEKPEQVDLFLREGRVGMVLRHPNIVEVLAVKRDPQTDRYFMVMEYVDGQNLRERLRLHNQIEYTETLRILQEAATGLAYAYAHGVTHRDIKLSNILTSASEGTVKLVDFGLTRLFSTDNPDKLAMEEMDRALDYAALEKVTGVTPGDVRSDIYFLGCVGYHLLSGRPPLDVSPSRTARMQRMRFGKVAPLQAEQLGIPPAVATLIESMMALDPNLRFQTPAHLVRAIKKLRRHPNGKQAAPEPDDEQSAPEQTIFIVERNSELQAGLRAGFSRLGYRVLLAGNPDMAWQRFRMQPYDALIVNAGTVGPAGRDCFEQILTEARFRNHPCVGVLVLADEQAAWASEIPPAANQAVVMLPILVRQLNDKIQELAGRASVQSAD